MKLASKRLLSSSNKTAFLQGIAKNIGQGLNSLKGTVMQAMAERMNENDRANMMSHWGATVDAPIARNEQEAFKPVRMLPVPNLILSNSAEEVNLFHPVLGELVADLGYKKLYLTNVRSLTMAPIWKKQRILRPERAQVIAADKIKNKLGSSISGTISFFINKKTKEIGIIDGQHRAGALMLLAQKGHWSESERNILVEVFSTETDAQVSALFREINAAEPVRLVDMVAHEDTTTASASAATPATTPPIHPAAAVSTNGEVSVAATAKAIAGSTDNSAAEPSVAVKSDPEPEPEPDYQELLTWAAEELAREHAEMFKPSSRCKPPHLNVDVLRDDLFQSDFLPRHRVASALELLQLLRRANASIGARAQQAGEPQSKAAQAALKKATEHGFYLGLDKAWMYGTVAEDTSK